MEEVKKKMEKGLVDGVNPLVHKVKTGQWSKLKRKKRMKEIWPKI